MQEAHKPVPKVKYPAIAGAIVIVGSFIVDLLGIDVPPQVAASATVVVSAIVGWYAPRT